MTAAGVDIVDALRRLAADGTRSDRRLAGLVLGNMAHAARASIAELAQGAEVSDPTVTRFCRALGCEGIREFKFHLAQALAIGGPYLAAASAESAGAAATAADGSAAAVDIVCNGALGAIEAIRKSLSEGSEGGEAPVAEAGARLARASQVFAFGSGGSSSIAALELQHRLFRLGIPVTAYMDGEMQRMTASVADGGTVVVIFSISGHVRAEIEAADIARRYGAGVITVTQPGSALAARGVPAIPFTVNEDANLLKPSSSRYGLLVVVDLLAMETAKARGPRVLEGLRRIKQSLNILKVNDPSLQIGRAHV